MAIGSWFEFNLLLKNTTWMLKVEILKLISAMGTIVSKGLLVVVTYYLLSKYEALMGLIRWMVGG
jgi:hypothetical protein